MGWVSRVTNINRKENKMAKYNHNESLGKNAIRGVDITEPEPE